MNLLPRLRLLADSLSRLRWFWAIVLLAILVLVGMLSLARGAVAVPSGELIPAAFDATHRFHVVVWEIRLPRMLVALLTGSSLAVSGALMQTTVRNPLADPGILGVTAGAGAAGLLAIVFVPEKTILLPLFAFGGAMVALAVILALSVTSARPGPLKLLLSGVAIQSALFSLIALISFFYADRAPSFVSFTVGSLNGVGWREARIVLVPALAGTALAWAASRPLNVLLFDEATAGGVGLNVVRTRIGASILAALLAAGAASVAGLVGFVGLVVPNIIRLITGSDHKTLIPLSALGGAALMLVADLAARTAVAPLELPVGAVLALFGAPYLLFLLWRKLP